MDEWEDKEYIDRECRIVGLAQQMSLQAALFIVHNALSDHIEGTPYNPEKEEKIRAAMEKIWDYAQTADK